MPGRDVVISRVRAVAEGNPRPTGVLCPVLAELCSALHYLIVPEPKDPNKLLAYRESIEKIRKKERIRKMSRPVRKAFRIIDTLAQAVEVHLDDCAATTRGGQQLQEQALNQVVIEPDGRMLQSLIHTLVDPATGFPLPEMQPVCRTMIIPKKEVGDWHTQMQATPGIEQLTSPTVESELTNNNNNKFLLATTKPSENTRAKNPQIPQNLMCTIDNRMTVTPTTTIAHNVPAIHEQPPEFRIADALQAMETPRYANPIEHADALRVMHEAMQLPGCGNPINDADAHRVHDERIKMMVMMLHEADQRAINDPGNESSGQMRCDDAVAAGARSHVADGGDNLEKWTRFERKANQDSTMSMRHPLSKKKRGNNDRNYHEEPIPLRAAPDREWYGSRRLNLSLDQDEIANVSWDPYSFERSVPGKTLSRPDNETPYTGRKPAQSVALTRVGYDRRISTNRNAVASVVEPAVERSTKATRDTVKKQKVIADIVKNVIEKRSAKGSMVLRGGRVLRSCAQRQSPRQAAMRNAERKSDSGPCNNKRGRASDPAGSPPVAGDSPPTAREIFAREKRQELTGMGLNVEEEEIIMNATKYWNKLDFKAMQRYRLMEFEEKRKWEQKGTNRHRGV